MRIEQLTFTRFVAAISIVIFHYGSGSFLFNNEYVSFIFKQANVGVSYFFVLSGFVMIIAYGNRKKIKFLEYIKNRLARIYPVYFLAILLILVVNLFRNIDEYNLFLNLFMIQSWISEKALTINVPGWSLSVELFFYVSFPFLFNHFYLKKSLKNLTIWILSFWIISQILYHLIINGNIKLSYYNIRDIRYYPLMHFNEFLVGNLTGLFFIKKIKNNIRDYSIPIILTLITLITLLKFTFGLNYHNGLLLIVFVPLIILISLSNDKFTQIISRKSFVFLGEISFGIYILQAPVWLIFSDYRMDKYLGLNKEVDFTESFIIRIIILIILSSLSYLFFEKPIRNKIKNYAQHCT
ncbi:acyltransferase [Polaribacter sp. MSW13]|uniref:Acyltransferase n=1 Tax=Polaribacter marinus TaxID=2916838 RepID=A0A9X1VLS1_9FLAO|nr:acyltransferase [Polaribacter marinus]MCI2228844.1 acyltransferase [Polaribacter marinus]